jgi:hypothetical protein
VRLRDPGPEPLRQLRRIADRAALVAAALGRQPSLVSCADVEIAAKAGTVPAAVSELVRALTEWDWIEGVGSARHLLAESGWRLQGIADCGSSYGRARDYAARGRRATASRSQGGAGRARDAGRLRACHRQCTK